MLRVSTRVGVALSIVAVVVVLAISAGVVTSVLPQPQDRSDVVDPPVPTQPLALPNLASGTLPDGRRWTIDGTQYRDPPDENTVCGSLGVGAEEDGDVLSTMCTDPDGTQAVGPPIGTNGSTVVFGATPPTVVKVVVELTGGASAASDTVASSDPSITARWFVVDVGDTKAVRAIEVFDANGASLYRKRLTGTLPR